jgi:hypothetical protein
MAIKARTDYCQSSRRPVSRQAHRSASHTNVHTGFLNSTARLENET